ncbi:MAG: serine/threonine protein kinase [Myxococcales bacterium]|nr:serine/threonine protein kinase [Myxococcales bacterium]
MPDPDSDTLVAGPPDEEPTSVAAPSQSHASSSGSGSTSGQNRSGSAGTTNLRTRSSTLILKREEAERVIAIMKVMAIVAVGALITQWIPKDLPYRPVCTLIYGGTLVITAWLLLRFRDRSRYDARLAMFQALCGVACVLAAAASVGVFSGTIVAAALGIFFYGSGDDKPLGWVVFLTLALGYLLFFVLSIAGVMPLDRGLVRFVDPDLPGLVVLSVELETFLAVTFWSARRARSATRDAFLRLEGAARSIEQRDALLNEARADLDREQAARLGRYTGQTVDGYMVDALIGRGAMGEVYAAQAADGSPAALKFLNAGTLSEPGALTRFFREAEVAATLSSPYLTRLLGTGRTDDGAPYLAMELLSGEDLGKRLRHDKRLGAKETLELVEHVAEALEVARANGIVHRDIKPQNLFHAAEGGRKRWKVLDFGVSKLHESQATLTQGATVGTPSYMSPEQARGGDVDHRSDVFALGVVTYRVLTGRPAFTGADSMQTLYNVVYKQPARPSGLVKLNTDVERVLALVLAKRRELRPATARHFAALLADAFAGKLSVAQRRVADELITQQPWGSELRGLSD